MPAFTEKLTYNKLIFYVAWLLCFSIPLPISSGRYGFLSALLFLLWLAEGKLRHKLQQLLNCRPFLLILAIVVYSLLSLLWSDSASSGLDRLSPYKYYLLLIPPLITSIPANKVKTLISGFVLGVVIHAVAAYLIYISGYSGTYADRIYTPYAIYGPFTAFCALYFLNRFMLRSALTYNQPINIIVATLLIILLFLMPGRSGQVIFIAGAVLLIWLHHSKLTGTVLLVGIFGTVIMLLAGNIESTRQKYDLAMSEVLNAYNNKQYTGSTGTRIGLATLSLEASKRNPVFGAGMGSWRDETQRVIERGVSQDFYVLGIWDTPHNQYITQFTSLGIVGLLLLIIYIYVFFRLDIASKELKILSILFISLFCLNCFNDEILFMKPYNIYFAALSALFINLASQQQSRITSAT